MEVQRPGRENVYSPNLVYRLIVKGAIPLLPQYTFMTHNFTLLSNIYNNNHGSTALYGLRPPLSEVIGSCANVAVGD
jgi:hypothetical protein